MNRTRSRVEVRAVERKRAAESFGDAVEREFLRECGFGHSPVGALIKVHGTLNVAETSAASARTPSVSVA